VRIQLIGVHYNEKAYCCGYTSFLIRRQKDAEALFMPLPLRQARKIHFEFILGKSDVVSVLKEAPGDFVAP
jgi:predicted DCC family thiol-disulfide oxidoreductase YuxK